MFIENDPIMMNIIVKNDLNVTKIFVSELKFSSISNPDLSDKRIFVDNLSPLEEKIILHRTNLTPGQWKMELSLHINSTDCCHVHGYQTWIVVQPVQDYYNLLTASGTIFGSLAAIIAVVLQAWSNRKNLVESRKERSDTLEEMGKQREISLKSLDLTHKEFESTIRPWIGNTKNALDVSKLYNDKNEFQLLDEWKKMSERNRKDFKCTKVEWKIKLKNFGQIPGVNIQGRVLVAIENKPIKEKFGDFGQKFVLMPNDDTDFMFTLDAITSDIIQNSTVVSYLCLDLVYGSSYSKQQYRYGITLLMTGGTGYRIVKTWDEQSFDKIESELLD